MQGRNPRNNRRNIAFAILIMILNFGMLFSQNNAPNDIPFQSYDKKLNPEHRLHFLTGSIASWMSYDITYKKTRNKNRAFWNGVATSFFVGIVKESIDASVRNSTLDKNDLFSSVLGGITTGLTLNILNKTKHEKINNKLVRDYRKHKRKQSRKKR